MFKSARWRTEKHKFKEVFKLKFHATKVPQLNVDGLVISILPGDLGKPTVRLEKAAIRDGNCCWENTVYETVKFSREPKTGKINERIYHFLVSTGSSKASLVGEVSIDFANYAEAKKASSVALPLKYSNSDAVLHVGIQRMQGDVNQREIDENESTNGKTQDRSLKSQLTSNDSDEIIKHNATEDRPLNRSTPQLADLNGDSRASTASDITMSSSESSSGLNTPRELGNVNTYDDASNFLSSLSHNTIPQKPTANSSSAIYSDHQSLQWEWSSGSAPEVSTDESTNCSGDTVLREKTQQTSENENEKLKTDLSVLSRQVELSDVELQTLRKQIVKEGKKGQDLSKEVVSLKDERDALREECDSLKAFKKRVEEGRVRTFQSGDPFSILEEIRQELNYEKDLNSNLRLQLQKTQESNSELILAVRDFDEMLEQKNREISHLLKNSENNESSPTEEDEEQKALEDIVKEHNDVKDSYFLEQKVIDLYGEIDIYRREKDEVEMQMEQLALDYEILKQENHQITYKLEQYELQEQLKIQYEYPASFASMNELETQIESLENELKEKSKEFEDLRTTIKELETHVKSLEDELDKRTEGFEADLEAITRAKVEQEQRAIKAEEALRKTRLRNAHMAEKIQEEFKRLSLQMTSTFDANEKVAMTALEEAGELRMQKINLEEMQKRAGEELQSVRLHYETQIHLHKHEMEKMVMEIEGKSKELESQRKHEEESFRATKLEIELLKAEIERLRTETEQSEKLKVEMDILKKLINEYEAQVKKGNMEKNVLEDLNNLARKEAENSLAELNNMRSLKDEKEAIARNLFSEVGILKSQYDELKCSLFESEIEKEKLRNEVIQLKVVLKKKEDAFNSTEKKLKDGYGRSTTLEGAKVASKINKSPPVNRGSKDVANLKEKIKMLEGQIKVKETALQNSTNSFLQKEKELGNKIEELESRLEDLNQDSTVNNEHKFQKVAEHTGDLPLGSTSNEEMINFAENLSVATCMPEENGLMVSIIKSGSDETLSEKESETSTIKEIDEGNLKELLNEMALLKERNKTMEGELKDMQERYSEISLKFAEVEGERQQLVMTLRNLKNSKKS